MAQVLKIDECTKEQMYDLLASLDVDIEKVIKAGWTVEELRAKYRAMLARQLRDFKNGNDYYRKMIQANR